jgi:hypothetical protein
LAQFEAKGQRPGLGQSLTLNSLSTTTHHHHHKLLGQFQGT